MLKRRERPSALFECGRPLSAYLGALVTVLRFLGVPLPVPFKSELF